MRCMSGLVRAAGMPARDVYGIRVAPSKFGYKSLGAGSEVITKAQHCRAETFVAGHGWVAIDPADVRKVVLEEPPGNLALDDPKVVDARKTCSAPGKATGSPITSRTTSRYRVAGTEARVPHVSAGGGGRIRLDCLDPDTFKYTITSKEITSA